jgi:hypothetical protein
VPLLADHGAGLGLRELERLAPQLELRHGLTAEHAQRDALRVGQLLGHGIGHREGADGVPVSGAERRTGVEADVGSAEDQGMVGEALVEPAVLDDVQVGGVERVATKTQRARQLGEGQADA